METGSGVVILIVVTLCMVGVLAMTAIYEKYLLKTSAQARLDDFRAKVREESEKAFKEYKGSIHEQNFLYGQLVEQKGQVLKSLYVQMGDLLDLSKNFQNTTVLKDLCQKCRHLNKALQELLSQYRENAIILPERFCAEMESFLKNYDGQITLMETLGKLEKDEPGKDLLKVAQAHKAWSEIEGELKKLQGASKRDFAAMYRGSEAGNTVWF